MSYNSTSLQPFSSPSVLLAFRGLSDHLVLSATQEGKELWTQQSRMPRRDIALRSIVWQRSPRLIPSSTIAHDESTYHQRKTEQRRWRKLLQLSYTN